MGVAVAPCENARENKACDCAYKYKNVDNKCDVGTAYLFSHTACASALLFTHYCAHLYLYYVISYKLCQDMAGYSGGARIGINAQLRNAHTGE